MVYVVCRRRSLVVVVLRGEAMTRGDDTHPLVTLHTHTHTHHILHSLAFRGIPSLLSLSVSVCVSEGEGGGGGMGGFEGEGPPGPPPEFFHGPPGGPFFDGPPPFHPHMGGESLDRPYHSLTCL
jgi:hypothetical protein